MRHAIRDVDQLCHELNLPDSIVNHTILKQSAFPLFVPRPFLQKMESGRLDDPLLMQVLPLKAENNKEEGFVDDPVGDLNSQHSVGLLKKYKGRALLIATGACPVHCRYCFRRHFPYEASPKSLAQWAEPIRNIESDTSIEEILLSGGDPLTLVDDVLAKLIDQIESIPHVKRLRIHTRFPIMIPSRINSGFLRIMENTRLQTFLVVHANHPNEIGDDVMASFHRLRQGGVTLLNQSVLLKDINDSTEIMVELSRNLTSAGVIPYYLHQLDRVTGAAHFEVDEQTGIKIITEMRAQLPGYGVPRFVREEAGMPSKTILI